MHLRRPSKRFWLSTLLGGLVFLWLGFARTLNPTDIDWIALDDSFTHVMGWEHYRNEPLAQYPITKNGSYGMEWGSTLVFSDSIPIVALPLRPLAPLLPRPFQYLGWWTLLCLVLQAYWGARLVELRTKDRAAITLGSAFFVTAPVILNRIGLHTALASQWLVLWALWLYITSTQARSRAWAVVLFLAITIHAYLFFMVGALWAAHLGKCALDRTLTRRDLAAAGGIVVGVAGWMHALGYFMIGGGAASGGGLSRWDLASPIAGGEFTTLLPPMRQVNWDGNAYLGVGLLLLLATGGVMWTVHRVQAHRPAREIPAARPRWPPLVIVVGGLTLFAISNEVILADRKLLDIPLPGALKGLYGAFRGAARMIWPAYYLGILATVWLAVTQLPKRAAIGVLAAALAVQVIDIRAGVAFKAHQLDAGTLARPLRDPVWQVVARRYQRIVSVPAYHAQPEHTTLAWFAARNHMATNIGFFSRSDSRVRRAGGRTHIEAVLGGHYEPSTVYYFPGEQLFNLALQAMTPDDVAMIADGDRLLLPGGRRFYQGASLTASGNAAGTAPVTTGAGSWITFAGAASQRGLLVDGWSWQEDWGLWSADREPQLILPAPAGERVHVSFRWIATAPRGHAQRLTIHIDDQTFETLFALDGAERTDTFDVTAKRRWLDVRIECHEPVVTRDQRLLGVGLIAARVARASEPGASEALEPLPEGARAAPMLDTWVSVATNGPGRALLGRGWSWPESWGTWSSNRVATLAVPVPPNERVEITLRWLATAPLWWPQRAHVVVDDHSFDVVFPQPGAQQESSFVVQSTSTAVRVRVEIGIPVRSADGRQLGVGLAAVRVRRAP